MKNEPFIGSGIIDLVNKSMAFKCSKELGQKPANSTSIDLSKDGDGERQVAAWFLGPRAENLDMFMKLVEEAITDHAYWRRNFHPEDPTVITDTIQREPGYLDAMGRTKSELFKLLGQLKGSVPFSSMRYQGHMSWDQTIPGMVAYVAAMLYNQNNTATEASPVTTVLEYLVGQDLCRMFGYQTKGKGTLAWGHLTCGGTTANIEAQWAARNAKYYPIAIKKAVESGHLPLNQPLMVTLPDGLTTKDITTLNSWELVNLTLDETLALPERLLGIMLPSDATPEDRKAAQDLVEDNTTDYLLQNTGMLGIYTDELLPPIDGDPIKAPVFFVPASKHYSLPKGAAILGVGGKNLRPIPLDRYGRMDTAVLRQELDLCKANLEPVISVTTVFGTTEEGNVDPLEEVLQIRSDLRAEGFDFAVHADAAWGGYFAAMLARPQPKIAEPPAESGPAPVLPMSDYVFKQYELLEKTDTITVDPHKTGYLPYPAGALCYRNKLMRSLVAFSAPYTNTSNIDESSTNPCRTDSEPEYPEEDLVMGLYGIEGSKPGAAAAGVYLSHAVIPTDPTGYGTLLGRTLFNCKLFHLALLELNEAEINQDNFYVVPVPHTGNNSVSHKKVRTALKALHGKSYNELSSDPEAMELLKEQGADLNIICFAFNFKNANGHWNTSLTEANKLNQAIFDRCGVKLHDNIHDYRFVTSATSFPLAGYGEVFFNDYAGRLLNKEGTTDWDSDSISVMRSVIMDPWLTESRNGEPFLKEVVAELGSIVCEEVRKMNASSVE